MHQLTHIHGLPEGHLIDAHRHHITSRVAAGTRKRNLIQLLQDRATMHIARKVCGIRRHQNGHGQLMYGQDY